MTGSFQSQSNRAGASTFTGCSSQFSAVSVFIYVAGRTLAVPGTNVKATFTILMRRFVFR
jgi:hypothetical protein